MSANLSRAVGEQLREAMQVSEAGDEYAACRARLVKEAQRARTRRNRNRKLYRAAAPILAAAIVIFALTEHWRGAQGAELAFAVGPGTEPGRTGVYYAAKAEVSIPLRFADGSKIVLEPRAGLRVSEADRLQVSVLLETGGARFDVVPRPGARWEISAGPYLVRVTGTSFWLSWDTAAQALALQMRSGSVLVFGPGIETGHRVAGTERFDTHVTATLSRATSLRDNAPPRTAALRDLTTPGDRAAQELPRHPSLGVGVQGSEPSQQERTTSSAGGAESRSTARSPRKIASAERVGPAAAEARSVPREQAANSAEPQSPGGAPEPAAVQSASERVQAAERAGVSQVASRASAHELLSLADAARFARRPEIARPALLAVRSRFPATAAASSAAFVLGRLADDAGNLREAVSWYDLHTQESGSLAPEAFGRKMLALHRLGEPAARDRAATEYLQRFPNGPYARQARDLISR